MAVTVKSENSGNQLYTYVTLEEDDKYGNAIRVYSKQKLEKTLNPCILYLFININRLMNIIIQNLTQRENGSLENLEHLRLRFLIPRTNF